jgi:hypothetical protein
MGSGKHLKRSQFKHGIENFKKEILFQFDNEADMNAKEAELVTEEFCLREDTYNLCPGGKGGFGYINGNNHVRNGFEKTIDIKAVRDSTLASASRGRKVQKELWDNDEEWRDSIAKKKSDSLKRTFKDHHHWSGRTHSVETKQKISKANSKMTGGLNSQFGTMWITDGHDNKKIKKDIDIIPEGWYKGRKIK